MARLRSSSLQWHSTVASPSAAIVCTLSVCSLYLPTSITSTHTIARGNNNMHIHADMHTYSSSDPHSLNVRTYNRIAKDDILWSPICRHHNLAAASPASSSSSCETTPHHHTKSPPLDVVVICDLHALTAATAGGT